MREVLELLERALHTAKETVSKFPGLDCIINGNPRPDHDEDDEDDDEHERYAHASKKRGRKAAVRSKYLLRASPALPATAHIGQRRRGNDGLWYVSVPCIRHRTGTRYGKWVRSTSRAEN